MSPPFSDFRLICSGAARVIGRRYDVKMLRNCKTNQLTTSTVVGSKDGISFVVGEEAQALLLSGQAVAGSKRVLGAQLSKKMPRTAADLVVINNLAALSVNGAKVFIHKNVVKVRREWWEVTYKRGQLTV